MRGGGWCIEGTLKSKLVGGRGRGESPAFLSRLVDMLLVGRPGGTLLSGGNICNHTGKVTDHEIEIRDNAITSTINM